MQTITLTIRDDKVPFFMDLIKNFKFVQVKDEGDSKEEIIANLTQAFKDAQLFREGKLKTTPAKEFLNELQS